MFGNHTPRHIDLHLPQSWNRCTTEELEAIAAAIIQEQQSVGRYHPFDWQRVKLAAILSINKITVIRLNEETAGGARINDYPINRLTEGGNAAADAAAEWMVQRPDDEEPWPVSVGQLLALTDLLAWIDSEKADKTIFLFPYPEMVIGGQTADNRTPHNPRNGGNRGGNRNGDPRAAIALQGPPPLLDGYTWKEYRWLTDWMQEYMRISNALAQARGAELRARHQAALDSARGKFLAVLFKPAERPAAHPTGTAARGDAATVPAASAVGTPAVTAALFADFDPVRWQVILFWWSSLMAQLARKFPRVFKTQPVGKGRRGARKQDTPWDFYNRVTATIQKYVGGLSAQDVDVQPYGVTLQQLEMMADEAAEMEKLKAKK